MSNDLKRIIIISIVNAVALYYTNKLLSQTKVIPPKTEEK